jgi:hypothetical protein
MWAGARRLEERVTPPLLCACYFNETDNPKWRRMAQLLEFTAHEHCPNWQIRVDRIYPAAKMSATGKRAHIFNAQKQEHWTAVVSASQDGDRILLLDADTLILRPLDDIWDQSFDLAYTTRAKWDTPLNGGVMFLRSTPQTRDFIARWTKITNSRLREDQKENVKWRRRFGGIAQGALGDLLTTPHKLVVRPLPCQEWNCEDSAWPKFNPQKARILHIKGELSRAIFANGSRQIRHKLNGTMVNLTPMVALWKRAEATLRERQEHTA